MIFASARQVWHDCLKTRESAVPLDDILTCTIQRGSRDANMAIVDMVERGKAQNIIARLREKDPIAWHWGMVAYAPAGQGRMSRGKLLDYLCGKEREPMTKALAMLAVQAIHAASIRDTTSRPLDVKAVRRVMGVDKAGWDEQYRAAWVRFLRRLDPLPERALSELSGFVIEQSELREEYA